VRDATKAASAGSSSASRGDEAVKSVIDEHQTAMFDFYPFSVQTVPRE
jgi:hypothetical protein